MRWMFALALVLFATSTVLAQEEAYTIDGRKVILFDNGKWKDAENDPHFRQAFWGMSKDQVKQKETARIIQEDMNAKGIENYDIIGYEGQVLGLPASIIYVFAEDKLVRTQYVLTAKHANENDYIKDYKKVRDGLADKYRKPEKDETIWKDNDSKKQYKDQPEKYGTALMEGHLRYYSSWETTETNISLGLQSNNGGVYHVVEYISNVYDRLEEKVKKMKSNAEL